MRHLRLVTPAESAALERPTAEAPGTVTAVTAALDDDLPLLYVPARLVLALAGRCSCLDCCTAYAEHRPEPHDPRRERPRHLRAI
jgi:hypothetical protein